MRLVYRKCSVYQNLAFLKFSQENEFGIMYVHRCQLWQHQGHGEEYFFTSCSRIYDTIRGSYSLPQIPNSLVLGQNIITFNRSQKIKDFTKSKKFFYQNTPEKKHVHCFRLIKKLGVRCTLKLYCI